MDRTPLRRRLAGLCLAMVAAFTLATITTTSAAAQTTRTASTFTVINPGNQLFWEGSQVYVQMTATGGVTPYTWSATGLPPYVSINASTGLISGPATPGIRNVTVTAADAAGSVSSVNFVIRVPLECRTC
ncbi:Ig domain-containing protein [Actinophytocola sp.]|uniref:Ig domain-containing protein n=1 Tax=Actinophytocola sp. TaxID=1872138 RepID=UPI002ED67B2B